MVAQAPAVALRIAFTRHEPGHGLPGARATGTSSTRSWPPRPGSPPDAPIYLATLIAIGDARAAIRGRSPGPRQTRPRLRRPCAHRLAGALRGTVRLTPPGRLAGAVGARDGSRRPDLRGRGLVGRPAAHLDRRSRAGRRGGRRAGPRPADGDPRRRGRPSSRCAPKGHRERLRALWGARTGLEPRAVENHLRSAVDAYDAWGSTVHRAQAQVDLGLLPDQRRTCRRGGRRRRAARVPCSRRSARAPGWRGSTSVSPLSRPPGCPRPATPPPDGSPTMGACRPRCPRVSPRPPTARFRRARSPGLGQRPFGFYVHVPFCTVRCGYCDFNTYTADELGDAPGASRATYAEAAVAEVRLARRVLGDVDVPVETVFFGGGTPTLLPPGDLTRVLAGDRRGVRAGRPAPRSPPSPTPTASTADDLARLREGGVNRVSFGMQSAVPHVLRVLDRTHDPRAGAAGRGLGARGRLRAGQPRPDLRHAGGVRSTTGPRRSTPRSPASRTTCRRTR